MKKLILFSAFLFCTTLLAKAQWVSIPDSNFGKWLNGSGYSQCLQGNSNSGWNLDTLCASLSVDTLAYMNNFPIRDLTGVQYLSAIKDLQCSNMPLMNLPALPPNLHRLTCVGNQLSSLPSLPNQLRYLDCSNNLFLTLPALPDSLVELYYLSYGGGLPGLTQLPNLPASLRVLYVPNNQLTFLPTLPDNLYRLECDYNQLTHLPSLPSNLTILVCNNNQLTDVPELPNWMSTLAIHDNPNLSCIPKLKTILNFSFSNTDITCVPNYGSITNSSPALNSLPLCGLFNNPNICQTFWNISGSAYLDLNGNCQKNSTDSILINVPVNLWSGANLVQTTFTNKIGQYSFDVDSLGTYVIIIDTANLPFQITCPSSASRICTLTPADSLFYSQDFGFVCDTGFDISVWSIVNLDGIFHPAIQNTTIISAGSNGTHFGYSCVNSIAGEVLVIIDGPAHYVGIVQGSLSPIVSGDTLRYSISDFGAVNPITDFRLKLQADSFAQAGQQVCIRVFVLPIAGDVNPVNNYLTQCFVVGTSYDPNDKQVYPFSSVDTSVEWLTYTVRFQNTGTSEAVHIYVTDTLNEHINPSSFQLLAYSHQPVVQMQESRIRFNFPNIHLPDSTANEPGSHGYIQYKVKLKDGLSIGTTIDNTAHIYFDFNSAVVTNTTTNTVCANTATNLSADICEGDTLNFEGQNLLTAGSYTAYHQNVYGCDSIVTLTLSVKPTPNAAFSVNGSTLTASTTVDTYEWWNCDLHLVVSTANSYVVTETGNYGLKTETGGCASDSVDCTFVMVSGITEINTALFKLHPNPANSYARVSVNESLLNSTLTLNDITGKELMQTKTNQTDFVLATESLPPGVYLITLTAPDGRTAVQKLVKQ